jgi:hypothetical protein
MKRISQIGAAVAAAVLASSAWAVYSPRDDLGSAADGAGSYSRVIVINSDTKSVNVERGETVKFVDTATGRDFMWQFDTAAFTVDLERAIPGAMGGQHVTAYVDGPEPGAD